MLILFGSSHLHKKLINPKFLAPRIHEPTRTKKEQTYPELQTKYHILKNTPVTIPKRG